jgi:hypothetical protein
MIPEIYQQYFQKSFCFLYPFLGFHRTKDPKPDQTYLEWPDECLTIDDKKLICVYKKDNTEKWNTFEKSKLITHRMLHSCVLVDDTTVVYIFDLNHMAADYEIFLNGKYSKLSANAKKMITDFYGIHTPEWVYIESFMFPAKYYKDYAKILKVDVDLLKEVGELCNKYNPNSEICKLMINQLN